MGQTGWILVAVGIVAIVVLMQRGSGPGSIVVTQPTAPSGNPAKIPFGNPPADQTTWYENVQGGMKILSEGYKMGKEWSLWD